MVVIQRCALVSEHHHVISMSPSFLLEAPLGTKLYVKGTLQENCRLQN